MPGIPCQRDWPPTLNQTFNLRRLVGTHHRKNGSQQRMKVPMMMPSVRAALCSRFILIKCLSLVGVCSCSTSCSVNVFDDPDPLSASPAVGDKMEI